MSPLGWPPPTPVNVLPLPSATVSYDVVLAPVVTPPSLTNGEGATGPTIAGAAPGAAGAAAGEEATGPTKPGAPGAGDELWSLLASAGPASPPMTPAVGTTRQT